MYTIAQDDYFTPFIQVFENSSKIVNTQVIFTLLVHLASLHFVILFHFGFLNKKPSTAK